MPTKPEPGAPKQVWYACYGSNLNYERLLCYIKGGTAKGRSEPNQGCRDQRPPVEARTISLDFELYFAGCFKAWGNAGLAFIRERTGRCQTLGRIYLITDDQFNDVVMQENFVRVDGSRFVPPIELLARQRVSTLPGNRWYGSIVNIGTIGGIPILTFTTTRTDLHPTPNRPSPEYLKVIVAGIKETYPEMTDAEIAAYFLRAEGIRGQIDPVQLLDWIQAA
jgi:hypothetical protein